MPTVYLPDFSSAERYKGLNSLTKNQGIHPMLIMACIELAVVSEGRANPVHHLPDTYTKGIDETTIEQCNNVALNVVERFDIRSHADFVYIRPMLHTYYHNCVFHTDNGGSEMVRIEDRWYVREWKEHKIKQAKNDFGVLMYMHNVQGDSGFMLAVDGKQYQMLNHAVTMTRNSYRNTRDKRTTIKSSREQEDWQRLLTAYRSIDLYENRDRIRVVQLAAIEAVESVQDLKYMFPTSYEEARYNHQRGFDDLVQTLELIAMQTRHLDDKKLIRVTGVEVEAWKDQCKTSHHAAELAARITAAYYQPATKPAPKKAAKAKTVKTK